eukprot:UN04627
MIFNQFYVYFLHLNLHKSNFLICIYIILAHPINDKLHYFSAQTQLFLISLCPNNSN